MFCAGCLQGFEGSAEDKVFLAEPISVHLVPRKTFPNAPHIFHGNMFATSGHLFFCQVHSGVDSEGPILNGMLLVASPEMHLGGSSLGFKGLGGLGG